MGAFFIYILKSSVCLVLFFYLFFGSYLAKKLFIALIVLLYWAYCFFVIAHSLH